MRKVKQTDMSDSIPMMRPALTPEAREKQLESLAIDLAERQMRDGTASAQVITHYLKASSTRDRLEQDLIKKKSELMDAQIRALQDAKKTEELYANALRAMRNYAGEDPRDEDNDNEE